MNVLRSDKKWVTYLGLSRQRGQMRTLYALIPEVAGGWGPQTEALPPLSESSVREVTVLDYQFEN